MKDPCAEQTNDCTLYANSEKTCAPIKIGLRFRTICLESSLGAFWIAKDAKFIHVDNKTDQTARMRRLI